MASKCNHFNCIHIYCSQNQQDAKHDPFMEQQAREWLEAVAGEPFPEGTFQEALKDGVYLCTVINSIQPGSVPKVNQSKMAFKMVSPDL